MTPDQRAALRQVREHMAALEVDIKGAEAMGAEPPFIIGARAALAQFFSHFVFALGIPCDDVVNPNDD